MQLHTPPPRRNNATASLRAASRPKAALLASAPPCAASPLPTGGSSQVLTGARWRNSPQQGNTLTEQEEERDGCQRPHEQLRHPAANLAGENEWATRGALLPRGFPTRFQLRLPVTDYDVVLSK